MCYIYICYHIRLYALKETLYKVSQLGGFRQHVCSEQGLYAEEMLYQTVKPDMDPVLIEEKSKWFFSTSSNKTLPQEYLLYAKKICPLPYYYGPYRYKRFLAIQGVEWLSDESLRQSPPVLLH